jgi:hypothetical protein
MAGIEGGQQDMKMIKGSELENRQLHRHEKRGRRGPPFFAWWVPLPGLARLPGKKARGRQLPWKWSIDYKASDIDILRYQPEDSPKDFTIVVYGNKQ